MGGRGKADLADSNDVLAQLGGGLHKHSGEHLHAWFGKAVDQAWALVSVTLSSAEALTGEDANALFNGGRLLHEVGHAGHHSGAVVAGPLTKQAPLLAKAKTLAGISGSNESGVEAHGHVRPPGGKTRLASSGIVSLGANLGDEYSSLLRN